MPLLKTNQGLINPSLKWYLPNELKYTTISLCLCSFSKVTLPLLEKKNIKHRLVMVTFDAIVLLRGPCALSYFNVMLMQWLQELNTLKPICIKCYVTFEPSIRH